MDLSSAPMHRALQTKQSLRTLISFSNTKTSESASDSAMSQPIAAHWKGRRNLANTHDESRSTFMSNDTPVQSVQPEEKRRSLPLVPDVMVEDHCDDISETFSCLGKTVNDAVNEVAV